MKKILFAIVLLFSVHFYFSQCTMTIVPIAQFGGPGTYVNPPNGFAGPYQVCNNAVVYDTLGTSNRRYYLQEGTTLYLKNAFFHYVYMDSTSTLVNLGGIGDHYVYKTIQANISGVITPTPVNCSAINFPTLTCNAPTVTGVPDLNMETEIIIYPNPTSDFINITHAKGKQFSIKDLSGRILETLYIEEEYFQFNVSEIETGIYLIEIKEVNQKNKQTKIIINR
ncbi:MAG: T9SS type A sorting domain-containing protein [Sphingobacteriaceae bacterium]|nr:T9SS type A sorting domain-containing protein [Sphingobacteriaceae bacterium]